MRVAAAIISPHRFLPTLSVAGADLRLSAALRGRLVSLPEALKAIRRRAFGGAVAHPENLPREELGLGLCSPSLHPRAGTAALICQ